MGRAFEFRKARKMKRWSQMARTFTRIGKDIVIAVKAGGPDPNTNAQLRAVYQNAKAANMPKENLERAIKRATDKDTSDYKIVLLEGYAPHGIAVLVETATDNNNRTVANVRSYFNKCNGNMGTSGSVAFLFERQCHFKIKMVPTDVEELELELIDYGAEEVFIEEGNKEENEAATIMIYGSFENFGSLQSYLEKNNFEIISSGFERIPTETKKLTPEQEADVEKLLERLEDDDDVQSVYHNMG
jgi:YebC/PmpR family DNA-binding regulatory protein